MAQKSLKAFKPRSSKPQGRNPIGATSHRDLVPVMVGCLAPQCGHGFLDSCYGTSIPNKGRTLYCNKLDSSAAILSTRKLRSLTVSSNPSGMVVSRHNASSGFVLFNRLDEKLKFGLLVIAAAFPRLYGPMIRGDFALGLQRQRRLGTFPLETHRASGSRLPWESAGISRRWLDFILCGRER